MTSTDAAMRWMHDPNERPGVPSVELITPEKAFRMLECNTHNRPLRQEKVFQYADDMRNGRWKWNGETIKFDKAGTLMDGQHRLWAITVAAKPIEMLIVRDLDSEAQKTIDIGVVRTAGDMLKLEGFVNTTLVASIATAALRYKNHPNVVWGTGSMPTKPEIMEFAEANAALLDKAQKDAADLKHIRMNQTAYGLVSFLAHEAGRNTEWIGFNDGMKTGVGLDEGDPRLTLRNASLRGRAEKGSWLQQVWVAFLIKGLNAHMQGKELRLLRFTRDNLPMPVIK